MHREYIEKKEKLNERREQKQKEMITWCSDSDEDRGIELITHTIIPTENRSITCPSCGHNIELQDQARRVDDLAGLPAGMKFDPNDIEILEHLEAKVVLSPDDAAPKKLHPLIDEFIPTLKGENGICYTHPEKLPGVSKDGQIRHFFHRPSKAYTTGTRKRRKVHTDHDDDVGSETRWHKTGKTRPISVGGAVKGFKKILVLYTNYGRQKKPQKTNWVMHQYHLGVTEEERDGELVVSKVVYQTQPRQCGNNSIPKDQYERMLTHQNVVHDGSIIPKNAALVDYYCINPPFMNYDHIGDHDIGESSPQLIPNLVVQGDSSFIRFTMDANKARLGRK